MAFSASEYMKLRQQRLSGTAAQSSQPAAAFAPADDFSSKYLTLRQERIAKDVKAEPNRVVSNINTQSNSQENKRTWFKAGEFRDGYQFGDVTKTILGTEADIVEGLQAGILGAAEGVVDTGAYIAGGIGGLLGANDFKDNMEEFIKQDLIAEREIAKKANLMDVLLMSHGTNADNSSLLGDKSDSLVQSGGQLLATAGLQTVGVPWFVTTGFTSFGGEADNALNQGATFEQAGVSAAVSAGAEILTEKLFGGSGLGEKGLINLEPLTAGISRKLVKALSDFGIDMASEGIEEVVSQFASSLGSKLYREENLSDILFSEEAIDSYIESFISGAAMGGFANVRKLSSSIKDARSNNPSPQQATAQPSAAGMPETGEDALTIQVPGAEPSAPSQAVTDLVDEAIARATNAPADPLSAAVDGFKANGTVTNKQAQDILNNTKAVTALLEQTGIKLPDTASGRRNAVKQAVAQLAQQAQDGSQTAAQTATPSNPMIDDLINALPGVSAEASPAQSQTRQELQEIIDAQLSPTQNAPVPIDTAQNSDYDDKNTTGGITYADAEHRGLSGASEAGLPGGTGAERLRGTDPQQIAVSGQTSGEVDRGAYLGSGGLEGEPGSSGFEVQLRDSPLLRVSDSLAAAQRQNGTKTYPVRDTTSQPQVYADALTAGRSSDPANGWCVTPKSAQEIQEEGVRTFMNDTGTVGVGIARNGDIVAVFKNQNGGPARALDTMMPIAIEQGGDRLDCYGEGLVRTYENYGFIPVARVEFNSEYANDGWTADKGTPYIYFMMHNGDTADQVASNIRKYPHATQEQLDALPTYGKDDYDAAMAYRDSLLDDGPTDLTTQPPSGPTDIGPAMPHAPGGSKVSKLHSNTYANATGEAVQGIGQRVQELDPNIARYDPITEKETFDQAIHRANSPEARTAEIEGLLGKDGWTAADNDTAYIILDKLRQEGDTVNFAALADKQRKMNTTGGQLIQSNAKYTRENLTRRTIDAINTLSDLTERDVPMKFWKDGGFGAWKKEVSRTILDISNKLEQAAENGSAEDTKQIIRSLAQFRRTTAWFGTSSNLTKVAEKGLNYIDADTAKAMAMAQLSQIPEDFRKRPMGQVAETIRVHNMLAALTTVNRNLFGNGVIGLVDATSDSTAGRWADILLSKLTGKRTVGNDLAQGKAYLDAAAKSAAMAALCVELDIPMDSDSRFTEGTTRTFSPQGGPVTRFLGAYEKAMKYALEVTDQFFSGGTAGAVDQSLQSLSDKAGLTDDERAELARQTGLRRTFKEDRTLSKATAGVKKGLNQIGKGHLGLGNAVMPFARTGSNVTQTGADYTGAGLVIGLKEVIQLRNDLKNGKYKNGEKIIYAKDGKTAKERISLAQAQRRAATNIGRGITGVGTVALFTAAALCGVLNVHNDEDRDANALDQSGNLSGAQLNLSALLRSLTGESADWQPDDWVISMDFLEPFNSQMYLGYALSKEDGLADILKAYPEASISSIWQSVLDMPMMQGLSDVVGLAESDDPADAAGQLIGNQATGFIPSWMRQTAQWVDPYYRDTAGSNVWEKAGNQIISRIPFLSQSLPEKVDGLGREQIRHDGDFMGFLNTFVNPGQIEKIRTGELEAFIEGVAQASGEMGVYPNSVIPAQLTYRDEDGEKQVYPLQGQDREIYQKAYGETVTEVCTDLIDMEYFKGLDPEAQAAVLKNALSYAATVSAGSVTGYYDVPKYIAERPEGMSEAEAILRHTLLGSSTAYADLPIRTAVYVDTLVDAIIPETKADGTTYTNVRPIQKMEAVVADDRLDAYADALLREYLDESQERRYDAALTAGFTDDQFVKAYRQYLDAEGTNKQQTVIRYIQQEIGMSYAAAKKLYAILASRTTSG